MSGVFCTETCTRAWRHSGVERLHISSDERKNLCVECDVLRERRLPRVILSRMS